MRNKKLLSTVVASALVATTMAVPVMAADGGEVDVNVDTRTAVIRVEVPTSLEVAVNQFEKGDTGSQIYSEPFGIKNKSEIPVKVSVGSTASLASTNPITLVATKAAAGSSTAEGGEAWLAIAAQTSTGKYIETGDIKDLTETDRNVTTFAAKSDDATKAVADQMFYLSAVANPTVTYTKLAPTTEEAVKTAQNTSYAQIHQIEAISFSDATDQAGSQTELDAKIAAGNVYKIVTAGSTDTITLIEKGKSETYDETATGVVYYEDKGVVLRTAIAKDKVYVYGEAGDGGSTAFRYIGKLGEGKETWTKDDISAIQIKYDIAGVTATRYAEVSSSTENPLINGLYKEPQVPQVTRVTGTKITNPAGTTEYNSTTLAERIKSGNLLFRFDTENNDITDLAVTKIVVDGNEYQFTKAANSKYTIADSDGQLYTLTGFTANSVSSVEVYYGENLVIEYTLN